MVAWLRADRFTRLFRLGALLPLMMAGHPACALEIELHDAAPDRVERQRAYARGAMLPGTPDLERFDQRLAAKGLSRGNPIYIRIFKETSELELWIAKGGRFELFETYPVCHWTGTLGPKLREGDKQSPEGFYTVSDRQMRLIGRWPKAFNLGYPNVHDQLNRRTGSYILVHGGCSSTGCFAMTEAVQEEIYRLAQSAQAGGQQRFQVHVFPFRMTDRRMSETANHRWHGFWQQLKPAYDSFERSHLPPRIAVCGNHYQVTDGRTSDIGRDQPLSTVPLRVAKSGSAASCVVAPDGGLQLTAATVAAKDLVRDPLPATDAESPEASPRQTSAAPPAATPTVAAPAPSRQRVTRTSRPAQSQHERGSAHAGRSEVPESSPVPPPTRGKPSSNGLGEIIVKGAPRMQTVGG